MSLPYQPRFLYRRRRNSPVPSPYGEYINPSPGFDGFGGPSYTLGSLSNRPGSDWATPRYVRDEPDMFMAGMGDEPEDNGDGTFTLPDGTVVSAAAMAAMQVGQAQTMSVASASFWDAVKGELAKYGQAGLDFFKAKGSELAQRVANGEDVAKVIDEISGGTIKISTTAVPPQYVPAPPAGGTPAQRILALNIGNASVATIKPGTMSARLLPSITKSKMVLVLGAIAVGAFILLKKR